MRAERKMEAGVRVDISPRPRSPRILTTICRITSVGISETAAANGGGGRGKGKGEGEGVSFVLWKYHTGLLYLT